MTAEAIAALDTMPWVRVITAARRPLGRREELLAWLAGADLPPEATEILRAAWAHDSVTGPALETAWQAYLAALRIAEGVAEGRLDYRVVDEDLCCPDRHQVAAEIARQDAEAALRVVSRGGTPW